MEITCGGTSLKKGVQNSTGKIVTTVQYLTSYIHVRTRRGLTLIYVVFTMIPCGTNFCDWQVIKLILGTLSKKTWSGRLGSQLEFQ